MIDSPTIYSLGWTLIHSFWQLTLLAGVFYISTLFLRYQRPALRYLISLAFMGVAVSFTSLTFIMMYSTYVLPLPVSDSVNRGIIQLQSGTEVTSSPDFLQSIVMYLESNVSSLTYMYMIGLGILFVRMIVSYRYLNRLKYQSNTVSDQNLGFLRELVNSMNLKMDVAVRSSIMTNMPMVIGTLQPVVLIPASMLSNTAPHILKAIIAHELAHIKRYDFLINIFQSVIETLFFYHPAVWYFSYMGRRERELCCDQRAIKAGCPREDLARALSEVGELQRPNALTMSFGGHSNDLLNRVRYLLGLKPYFHFLPTHSVWYFGSLLGAFLLFSIGKGQFYQQEKQEDGDKSILVAADTVPKNRNLEIEKDVWVKNDDRTNVDTIQKYWYEDNSGIQRNPHALQIEVDTTFEVFQTDTIPGEKRTVIVQTDGKMVVIVNGDTVSVTRFPVVPRHPDMRKWQDSMIVMQRMVMPELQNRKLDSLMSLHRQNISDQRRYMKIQKQYLDSLNRHLPEMQSRLKYFQYSLPDSLHRFTFGTPHMPEMDWDSLFDSQGFSRSFKGKFPLDSIRLQDGTIGIHNSMDSLFDINGRINSNLFSDSLFSSFHQPYSGVFGFPYIHSESKEIQELNKKIRAKERELRELQRKKREKYREEYRKQREDDDKK